MTNCIPNTQPKKQETILDNLLSKFKAFSEIQRAFKESSVSEKEMLDSLNKNRQD